MDKIKQLFPRRLINYYHFLKAQLFHILYGRPSRKLKIIGVTGTDGKTTTSTLIYEILVEAGYKVALVTTISVKIGNKEFETGFHVTSPSPGALQKFLRKMVREKIEYVVLETTSHGLDQYRVGGIIYEVATFTNVSHEHLDYHGTYDNYLKTKAKLIDQLKDKSGFAVINYDDRSSEYLIQKCLESDVEYATYGFTEKSDIYASDLKIGIGQMEYNVHYDKKEFPVNMHLPGEYNVYNALGAIQVALHLGVKSDIISQALGNITTLEGRWEIIQEKPFKVVVDFAHTPNALSQMLQFAKKDNKVGKVHVVFGSAGKRDIEKRPLMGEVAADSADFIYLTAEDPRGETIQNINRQIAIGIKEKGKKEGKDFFSIPDRKEAISQALSNAKDGDTVVIAGKGHEKSLNLDGKHETPWSDQEIVKELLKIGEYQ